MSWRASAVKLRRVVGAGDEADEAGAVARLKEAPPASGMRQTSMRLMPPTAMR